VRKAHAYGVSSRHPTEQFTVGDNWGDADNRLARDLVQGMLPMIGLFAYVEVRPHGRPSGLGSTLSEIADPRFRSLRVTDRQSILGTLDQLFGAEGACERDLSAMRRCVEELGLSPGEIVLHWPRPHALWSLATYGRCGRYRHRSAARPISAVNIGVKSPGEHLRMLGADARGWVPLGGVGDAGLSRNLWRWLR